MAQVSVCDTCESFVRCSACHVIPRTKVNGKWHYEPMKSQEKGWGNYCYECNSRHAKKPIYCLACQKNFRGGVHGQTVQPVQYIAPEVEPEMRKYVSLVRKHDQMEKEGQRNPFSVAWQPSKKRLLSVDDKIEILRKRFPKEYDPRKRFAILQHWVEPKDKYDPEIERKNAQKEWLKTHPKTPKDLEKDAQRLADIREYKRKQQTQPTEWVRGFRVDPEKHYRRQHGR